MLFKFSLHWPEIGTCSTLHCERTNGGETETIQVRFKFIESWSNISSVEHIHQKTFNYVTVPWANWKFIRRRGRLTFGIDCSISDWCYSSATILIFNQCANALSGGNEISVNRERECQAEWKNEEWRERCVDLWRHKVWITALYSFNRRNIHPFH